MCRVHLRLLVDPGSRVALPGDNLLSLEPQVDLLLGVLDAVGAVADVAADIDGEVALFSVLANISGELLTLAASSIE